MDTSFSRTQNVIIVVFFLAAIFSSTIFKSDELSPDSPEAQLNKVEFASDISISKKKFDNYRISPELKKDAEFDFTINSDGKDINQFELLTENIIYKDRNVIKIYNYEQELYWSISDANSKYSPLYFDNYIISFGPSSLRAYSIENRNIHKFLDFKEEFTNAPVVLNSYILLNFKTKQILLNKVNLKIVKILNLENLLNANQLSEQEIYITQAQNEKTKLSLYNVEHSNTLWEKEFESPNLNTFVVAETIFAWHENKVYLFNKAGESIWESETKSEVNNKVKPVHLVKHKQIVFLLKNKKIQGLKLKTGASVWSANTHNKNTLLQPFRLSLNNKSIQTLELAWRYVGETLASPCGLNRICLYNPKDGTIISRIYNKAGNFASDLYIFKDYALILSQSKEESKILKYNH